MEPRITLITLGVDDIQRALGFYRDGLGLPTEGVTGSEQEHGAVVFFNMAGGLKMALYPRGDIALDAKVQVSGHSASEFTLAHNVGSKAEVDAVMAQVRQAGAVITDEPHDRFWGGYSGYFQDPDGHLWEVAWNPDL